MEQLDRQIQLALKPVGSDRDGEEAGEQQEQRQEKDADVYKRQEMIPIEDAAAEEIRDEATVPAEGAAMPDESLPPLPTQEAWLPAGQDWA